MKIDGWSDGIFAVIDDEGNDVIHVALVGEKPGDREVWDRIARAFHIAVAEVGPPEVDERDAGHHLCRAVR